MDQGKPTFKPTFIITYHPHAPDIRKWVRQAHPILLTDSKLKKIYPRPPSVVYRQAPNLKQILVKSVLRELPYSDCSDREQERPGCFKHNHPARGRRCETCPRLNESGRFTSTFTNRTYKMWSKFTCKSKFVVYLVTCTRCKAQYVGKKVNTMMERHNGHRREEERSTPLGRHFSQCGLKNFSLQIIAGVKEGEEEALMIAEGIWIARLATMEGQGGLNSKDEKKKM